MHVLVFITWMGVGAVGLVGRGVWTVRGWVRLGVMRVWGVGGEMGPFASHVGLGVRPVRIRICVIVARFCGGDWGPGVLNVGLTVSSAQPMPISALNAPQTWASSNPGAPRAASSAYPAPPTP